MKLLLRALFAVAFLVLLATLNPATPVFAQTTIDFETPNLGTDDRQIQNPYVNSGVTFTAEPFGWGDEVVGLVKNSATSACAEPSNVDQKLGTGRSSFSGGAIGLSGFTIRATFATPLAPPANVSAQFQTLAGNPIRIRLFDAANVEVGSSTDTASPAAGDCGFPGLVRARKTITASAGSTVAYALLDLDTSTPGNVFVIDDFYFDDGSASNFPAVAGDDVTRSLGSFRILVHPAFQPLMAGLPPNVYDPVSKTLQSPNLFDPNTVIGRSAPHDDGDATDSGGAIVGSAGTLVADSDFIVEPVGFQGPPGTHEVHTEVRSLNMTSWQCAMIPGVAVRAGIDAPGRPISPGEVEAKGVPDFPAQSFFNVFAEIDIPAMGGFPGGTLYNRNTDPLLIVNDNLLSFPPEVVYVHANTNAVPVRFLNDNPGFWSANDLFGWLVLAGHAVGFDCGDSELDDTLAETRPQQPEPVEIDHFRFSRAQIKIQTPTGAVVDVNLEGPATVEAHIDESTGKVPQPSDRLDQIDTEMVALELRGGSDAMPVLVRLDPQQKSIGIIQETANLIPGVLEIPPFAPGTANSFFDIYSEIVIGPAGAQQVLHTAEPIHMESIITHKPPRPGEGYRNAVLSTDPAANAIPLLNADGKPSGFTILEEIHIPRPPIEIDTLNTTGAVVGLRGPDGKLINVVMRGPTTVLVELDSLQDADPNGLEEVETEIVSMELTGHSALGPVVLRAGRDFGLPPSNGQIEEKDNKKGGRLDLPGPDAPFCTDLAGVDSDCVGTQADSFFDVLFEVEVGGKKLHNNVPLRLQSIIDRKPPKRIYQHVITEPIELFDENNGKTGIFLVTASHNTDPVEKDYLELTRALVGIQTPDGTLVNAILSGPSMVHVNLASLNDLRTLGSPGANGLEEVNTEIVSATLSNSANTVKLTIGQVFGLPASRGQIEEMANIQAGRLDLPGADAPLCTDLAGVDADCVGAQANSFFNVYFQVEVGGVKLHNREPLRLQAVIDKKPPHSRYRHVITRPIQLYGANGEPTKFFLVTAEHNTGPVEVDEIKQTSALVGLERDGVLVNTILNGDTTVEVDLASLGDDNSNDLEEVETELVRAELNSSDGNIKLRIGRVFGLRPSIGRIEEKENVKDGRLDLKGPDAPFCTPDDSADCAGTKANSFFDVFFEVEVKDVGKLHNRVPLRIEAMISQKPPKARYIHVITTPIELFDENGRPTGVFLVTARHNTGGPVEVDAWESTSALLGIRLPNGNLVNAILSGPSTAEADLGSIHEHSNGLEAIGTELVDMELTGSTALGNIRLTAGSLRGLPPSLGEIEEKKNLKKGRLDLPGDDDPLCTDLAGDDKDCVGARANSHFDVLFEVEVAGIGKLHNIDPLRMESMIGKKPPAARYIHVITEPIRLYDENNRPTEVFLVTAEHNTGAVVEHDHFEETRSLLQLIAPDGSATVIPLSGKLWVDVQFEGGAEGVAYDDDGDGLDEVDTMMTGLMMTGTSSMGPVVVTLNPNIPSDGEIEEKENGTPGTLDVPPFTETGAANSDFNLFLRIRVGDVELFNKDPKIMRSMITHKPPAPGDTYGGPEAIPLFDKDGKETGFKLGAARNIPNPQNSDIKFENVRVGLTLQTQEGKEPIRLRGPLTIRRHTGPKCEADDSNGNGLDDTGALLASAAFSGQSQAFGLVHVHLNPAMQSLGFIEERVNNIPGVLEIPSCVPGTFGDSFFDVWVEVDIGDTQVSAGSNSAQQVLHTTQAIRLSTPVGGEEQALEGTLSDPVELVDESEKPSGISLVDEFALVDEVRLNLPFISR